jgi:hypothetical protein
MQVLSRGVPSDLYLGGVRFEARSGYYHHCDFRGFRLPLYENDKECFKLGHGSFFSTSYVFTDRLCDLVVRVFGYRYGGPESPLLSVHSCPIALYWCGNPLFPLVPSLSEYVTERDEEACIYTFLFPAARWH